jgi:hypothetical protein
VVRKVIDRDEMAGLALSLEVRGGVDEEVVGAIVDEDLEVVVEGIVVFLDESIARILNVPCEVLDDKIVVSKASLLVVWVLAVVGLVEGRNQLRRVGLAGEEGLRRVVGLALSYCGYLRRAFDLISALISHLLLEEGDDASGLLLQ